MRVAATLFEQRGFAGVSMAEVARLARISKTTLSARYRDKEALFRAICSYACRVPAGRIAAVATHGREPRDVLAEFAAAIRESTSDAAADRFLRLAIFEAPRFPMLAAQIQTESRAITAPLAAYFASLADTGRLPDHDPVMLGSQFVALVTGGHDALLGPAIRDDGDARIAGALALVLPAIR